MTDFVIEKDIPQPIAKYRRHNYQFGDMEIGDSVFFAEMGQYMMARNGAGAWGKKNGCKFRGLRESDGGRIWRIE